VFERAKDTYNIIAFIDNNSQKVGKTLHGLPILPSDKIAELSCEFFIIGSYAGLEPIYKQLTQDFCIPAFKVIRSYTEGSNAARLTALRHAATLIEERKIIGNVAELGVYQGEFASNIQRFFPNRKLFLFDTFEGFADADVAQEVQKGYSKAAVNDLGNTSIDLVLSKMTQSEMCVIRKGFFPQTAEGLEDECFAFVSLDVDLYAPTLEGLRYFYPRLTQGGLIFLDDFFNERYSGVWRALVDYDKEVPLHYAPLGDAYTLIIIK
jgi:O-methyltransferase